MNVLLSCMSTTRQKNTCTFNVICSLHNHGLDHKLADHSIACRLNAEEKKLVSDMTLIMVQPKNIFSTLKRKILESLSNIRQLYNVSNLNNKLEMVQD